MNDNVEKSELQKMAEEDPRKFDQRLSYGIIEPSYDLDKVLYRLQLDKETSQLLLNRMIIKTFQVSEDTEQVFIEIFDKLADANKFKSKYDHDYVTETEVKVKANQAQVIVNNIKIPKPLRKAIFRTSKQGEILHVQTAVTKERAMKYGVTEKEMLAFAESLAKKKLIRTNIR